MGSWWNHTCIGCREMRKVRQGRCLGWLLWAGKGQTPSTKSSFALYGFQTLPKKRLDKSKKTPEEGWAKSVQRLGRADTQVLLYAWNHLIAIYDISSFKKTTFSPLHRFCLTVAQVGAQEKVVCYPFYHQRLGNILETFRFSESGSAESWACLIEHWECSRWRNHAKIIFLPCLLPPPKHPWTSSWLMVQGQSP